MLQFSIIAPVYKSEAYLHRFLTSIVGQKCQDFELILVDDGSPDSSGMICDEYSAKYHNVHTIHQQNGGVSSARNRGIEEAHGEWLLFFDSDDVVKTDALTIIKDTIIKNPMADVVIYSIEEVHTDGRVMQHKLPISSPNFYEGETMINTIFPFFCKSASFLNSPYSKAFRASIVKDNDLKFRKRVRGEDWLFVLNYFRVISSACAIPNILYSYMRNENSAMTKYCPEQFLLWCENWEYKMNLIKDFNLSVSINVMRNEMLAKVYYHIKEIMKHEPKILRHKKISDILHSGQMTDWQKAIPLTLKDAFYHMSLTCWTLYYR